MTAPDAEPGYQRLLSPGTPAQGYVAARFALDLARYYPGRRARDLHQPVLFCICDKDSVAPAKATLRHAQRAPRADIKRYDVGHFDIYVGEPFERVVADQLAFLERHVPASNSV
jgi:pimeloyl-ACP methyl ester carboxylesterase